MLGSEEVRWRFRACLASGDDLRFGPLTLLIGPLTTEQPGAIQAKEMTTTRTTGVNITPFLPLVLFLDFFLSFPTETLRRHGLTTSHSREQLLVIVDAGRSNGRRTEQRSFSGRQNSAHGKWVERERGEKGGRPGQASSPLSRNQKEQAESSWRCRWRRDGPMLRDGRGDLWRGVRMRIICAYKVRRP
jgi:hypothetical protein